MDDIMKIAKSMEESGYWWKVLTKQLKVEQKKKNGFSSIILGTLIASLLEYLLTGKGVKAKILLQGKKEQGRNFNVTSSLEQLWNRKILSKRTKFNYVYSRNNVSKIKDGEYLINLDKYKSIGIKDR